MPENPKAMTFALKSIGGNLSGGEWIAAEGEITEDSVGRLDAVCEQYGIKEAHILRLNTPGGSLEGGLRLGEWLREHKFHTEVGSAIPDDYGNFLRAPGQCVSAGAFAFIGGVSRDVGAGELGVHQFYNPVAWDDPEATLFNAHHLSAHQLQSALLIDFAVKMGVDPRFVSTASKTGPDSMHYFDEAEVVELKIRWNPKKFDPWLIEPMGNGVAALSRTQDRTQTATFYRRSNGVPRLSVTLDGIPWEWFSDALPSVETVHAFGLTFPANSVTLSQQNGAPVLEFRLPGVDGNTIASARWPGITVDGPRYMLSAFSYEMPVENAVRAIRIAMRNPI